MIGEEDIAGWPLIRWVEIQFGLRLRGHVVNFQLVTALVGTGIDQGREPGSWRLPLNFCFGGKSRANRREFQRMSVLKPSALMLLSVIKDQLPEPAKRWLRPAKRWFLTKVVPTYFRVIGIRKQSRYCIAKEYCHRNEAVYYDTTSSADEFQREVYLHAKEIMERENFSVIYDVGCGSALSIWVNLIP
jgi:hypothetical protein